MEGDSYGVQIWIKIISTDSLLYPSKKSKVGGHFAPLNWAIPIHKNKTK